MTRQRSPAIISLVVVVLIAAITFSAGVFSGGTLPFAAFLSMITGIGIAYTTFGTDRSWLLFTSGTLFLGGFLLFLYATFLFDDLQGVIYPAATLVTGINLLLLFFNQPRRKGFLLGGIGLLAASVLLLGLSGRLQMLVFTTALWEIVAGSWKFLLAAVLVPILLYAVSRNSGK